MCVCARLTKTILMRALLNLPFGYFGTNAACIQIFVFAHMLSPSAAYFTYLFIFTLRAVDFYFVVLQAVCFH